MRSLLGWAKYEADCSFAGPELSVLVAAKYRPEGIVSMAASEIAEGDVVVGRIWQAGSVLTGNADVLAFRYTTIEPSVSIWLLVVQWRVHGTALAFAPTPKKEMNKQIENMSRNSKKR